MKLNESVENEANYETLTLEDCLELARRDFDIVVDNGFVIDIIYRDNNTKDVKM